MNNSASRRHLRGRVTAACLSSLTLATLLSPAHAANKTYDGPDGGAWTTAANWNLNVLPVPGDDVTLGTVSAGVGNLNVSMNAVFQEFSPLNSLTLNSVALTSTMILNQTSAASHMAAISENIGTTTSLNTYNHSGGINDVGLLAIGVNSLGNTYNLSGTAQLRPDSIDIGVSGQGTLNQTGGTNTFISGAFDFSLMRIGVNAGGSGTYNLSAGTLDVDMIELAKAGNGTFNQSGGTASVSQLYVGGNAGTGLYTLSGGTLDANLVVADKGTFNFSGGVLTSSTAVTTGGIFNCLGSSMQGGATAMILGGGTFRLNGHNVNIDSISGTSGITESNGGNAVLTLSNSNAANIATYAAVLQNGNASILSLTKTGAFTQILSGTSTYTGATIISAGVLKAGSATGFSSASNFIVNGGTLDAGGLQPTIGSLSGSGGTVDIGIGSLTANGSNASTQFGGALAGTGSLIKAGSGQLTLNGGGLFSGTISIQAGSLRSTSSFGLPPGANIDLAGIGTSLNLNATQGVASLSGGALSTVNFIAASVLNVGNNTAAPTIYAGGFTGAGVLVKTGTSSLTLGNGAIDTTNTNLDTGLSFKVNGGLLTLNKADGTNTIGGALTIDGGTVHNARSNQIADTSGLNIAAGTYELAGFNETIGSLGGAGGTLQLGGGTLTVTQSTPDTFAGALNGPGAFNKSGSADLTLTNLGNFGGTLVANGGKLIVNGAVNATGLTANNGGTLRFNGNSINLNSGAVRANLGGTVEYSGATLTNGFLRGAGTHTVVAGATTTFNGMAALNSTVIAQNGPANLANFTNGGTINNNASLQLDGVVNSPSGILNVNSAAAAVDFTSTGVINIASTGVLSNNVGNLYLGGGSRTYIASGGTLLAAPATTVELNGGLLVNSGTVIGTTNVNFGSLATGGGTWGVVNVTQGGTFSPGALNASYSLVDDATFTDGATLQIELGGTAQGSEYDSVVSADHATLSGTISLSAINLYVPAYGVTHHVITSFSTTSGLFDHVTGYALSADKWLAVTYATNGVDVTAAIPGDANLDRSVNFDDLLTLAQQYGHTTGQYWTLGDFNGDGATNFDDLLTLAQHYNMSGIVDDATLNSALGDSVAADWTLARSLVPEPTSLAVLMGGGALPRRRRDEHAR